MLPRPLTLRDYQEDSVAFVLEALPTHRWATVVLPTAAGKTVVMQAIMARLGGSILAAVPLVSIEDALAEPVRFGDGKIAAPMRIRETGGLSALSSFFQGRSAAVTTHALLTRLDPTDLPSDLSGSVILLDEAHHAGEQETILHDIAGEWHRRSGSVVSVTATPFRTDGRPIGPVDAPIHRLSRRMLAAGGWCPSTVDVQVLQVPHGVLTDSVIARVVSLAATEDRVHVGRRVMPARRPTLIRIPPVGAIECADRVVAALETAGVPPGSILNMVGEGNEAREALLWERETARTRGFLHRRIDVIVACRRMAEGADWPFCSRVISLGLSDALLPTIQLVGRGSRDKTRIPDYPQEWADVVQYTAIVPDPPADEETRHVRRMLILAVGIDCDESARDWARFWSDLATGWRLPPPLRRRLTAAVDPGEEVLADAGLIGVATLVHLRGVFGRDPTLGEVAGLIDRWGDAAGKRALRRIVESLPGARKDAKAALAAAAERTVTRWQAGDSPRDDDLTDVLHHALLTVAAKHADLACPVTTGVAPGLRGVLTLPKLNRVVAEMVDARNAVCGFTDEEAARIVIAWHAAHDRWPVATEISQDISRLAGRRATLADLDAALRRRGIDLARICALADAVQRPPVDVAELKRVVKKPPWIPETTFESATSILVGRRRWDISRKLGRPEDLVALEMAARRGWRGLPGGQTLGQVIMT